MQTVYVLYTEAYHLFSSGESPMLLYTTAGHSPVNRRARAEIEALDAALDMMEAMKDEQRERLHIQRHRNRIDAARELQRRLLSRYRDNVQ